MSYSLEDLALDIKNTLETHGIEKGSSTICYYVKKALMDQNFIPTHLPDREEGELEREVLYEDKDYGFCICGHVYPKMAEGHPHDHGPSWAIYGQATGETEMTDWEVMENQSSDDIIYVKPKKNLYNESRRCTFL